MKSYKEFCSEMTAKLNELEKLHEIRVLSGSERTKILRGLLKLSRKAVRLEKRREAARNVNEHSGATLRRYLQAETAIQEAKSYIKKAANLNAKLPRSRKKPPWVTELGKVKTGLDVASENIKIRIGLLVGEIEPKKQKNRKLERYFDYVVNEDYGEQAKKWVDEYYRTSNYPLELGANFHQQAVEHWLTVQAYHLLCKYLSVTDSARYEIIQSFLYASDLRYSVELKTIPTTLDRKRDLFPPETFR
jgi:hypothetical protein